MRHRHSIRQAGELQATLRCLHELSQRQAKRLLDCRCVWVNRDLVWMARHGLRPGDELVVFLDPLAPRVVETLFEDESLLVVNKPAFIASVGSRSVETRLQRSEPGLRPAHRLDKETTGCLVFCRRREALDTVLGHFAERRVEKEYDAVVEGRVPWETRRFAVPLDGKSARSRCHRLAVSRNRSHLRVRIETGRKHQIRRHLAGAGFPVIGDKLYGHAHGSVCRQLLHATRIGLPHPLTGEPLSIRAPYPADFAEALTAFPGSTGPRSNRE